MTKHKEDCRRVFKKYDTNCPRCKELMAGSPAREGWQKRYYANKKHAEQIRKIPHDCKKSNCGPICTFGDW